MQCGASDKLTEANLSGLTDNSLLPYLAEAKIWSFKRRKTQFQISLILCTSIYYKKVRLYYMLAYNEVTLCEFRFTTLLKCLSGETIVLRK